jgi:Metal binding domain of Ada.
MEAKTPSSDLSGEDLSGQVLSGAVLFRGSGDRPGIDMDFESFVSNTLFRTRGSLTLQSDASLPYLLLNATLWDGDLLLESTRYMIINLEPGRSCGFDISENRRLDPGGGYLCLLEAHGPEGLICSMERRCQVVIDDPLLVTGKEPEGVSGGRPSLEYDPWLSSPGVSDRSYDRYEYPYPGRLDASYRGSDSRSDLYRVPDTRGDIYRGSPDSGLVSHHELTDVDDNNYCETTGYRDDSDREVLDDVSEDGGDTASFYDGPRQNRAGVHHEAMYMGSTTSDKYHRLDCRYAQKIKPENRIYFADAEDARQKGYVPCKVCNPH